jgi:hypothetical protein
MMIVRIDLWLCCWLQRRQDEGILNVASPAEKKRALTTNAARFVQKRPAPPFNDKGGRCQVRLAAINAPPQVVLDRASYNILFAWKLAPHANGIVSNDFHSCS